MITIVTLKDYYDITNSFTKEEIYQKYGRLVIMSKEEYEEHKKSLKRKNK